MSLGVSALRAVAHPVRLQMLSLMTGAELSAAELARELHISQANASYHVRVLAAAGQIVEAGEEKIRGGVAKRYRHPWALDAHQPSPDSPADAATARVLIEAMSQELVRRHGHRLPAGQGMTTDAELWVRPEVYGEVLALVRQASELIHDQAKPPRSSGTIHVNLTAALFEMSDPPLDDTEVVAERQPGDSPKARKRAGKGP